MQLPQGFVKNDARRGGEIQTAYPRPRHRDSKGPMSIPLANRWRKAVRLVAEEQTIARLKGSLSVDALGVSLDTNDAIGPDRGFKFREGMVLSDFDVWPIVQARSLQFAIVDAKAQAADQVQDGSRRRTQPGDIPSIRWNFRLPKRDLHHERRTDRVERMA